MPKKTIYPVIWTHILWPTGYRDENKEHDELTEDGTWFGSMTYDLEY